MFWKFFDRCDQKEIEGIESALRGMRKPLFDARKKEAVKAHLLSAIKNNAIDAAPVSMSALENQIRRARLSVKLSSYVKAIIREKIFGRIEREAGFFWVFRTKIIFKKAVSYTLVALVVVTGVFSFIARPQVVSAHPVTTLYEINGDVVVLRAGQTLVPQEDFTLYQSDIIDTRGGMATIKYFDSSISRLDKNTKIKLSRLFSDEKGLITQVELDFNKGQAWSMVLDLFDDSLFKVHMDAFTASVVDRATFSISAASDKTEIGVFGNLVDLTLNNGQTQNSVVLKGYKAVVKSGDKNKPDISPVLKKDLSFMEMEWVEGNIKKDREYIVRVAQEQLTQHAVASAPDKLEESLYLSLSEIEKLRVKLNIAEDKFIKGEALLADGKIDEARQNLVYLRQAIADLKAKADELIVSDPASAQKLKNLANEKILKYKRAFSIITPDLPLYEAKQAIRDIELMIADDDYQKVRITLDIVSSILLETQNMVDDNRYENAKENLAESKKLIEALQDIDLSKDSELLKTIVNKKADIVKMLTLIENISSASDIKKEAGIAKKSSIEAIIDTVSQADDPQSKEVIEPAVKDISDFIQTYNSISPQEGTNFSPKIQLFLDMNKSRPAADDNGSEIP